MNDHRQIYSSKYLINQRKGLWAENYVIREMQKSDWKLAARRKKLINGEVDIILRRGREIIFIEVKYINHSWNIFERISHHQKRKLVTNRIYYSLRFPNLEIVTAIAFVSSEGTNKLNLIRLEE